uniref:Uncharacterized protein n=1 Tax=Meloidogyne enterolobii TaxID=390850 RepID=A0A6V7VA74_MELEN|nr:unnamed protein product [Meloidogyne enterolobii]
MANLKNIKKSFLPHFFSGPVISTFTHNWISEDNNINGLKIEIRPP